MDAAFRDYEAAVSRPVWIRKHGGLFRFKEQNIPQALIQKLALVQSTLRAALLLLQHGHTMEQAMLQRVIDEANEDIQFLTAAIVKDKITPLHEQYLAAFWAEEFKDLSDPATHQSRAMAPRKKIRAYLANLGGKRLDPSGTAQAAKVVSKAYSGFVHGASPHIMESYGGSPPRFHTRGLAGSPRIPEYTRDLWNYMYRGLWSHISVSQAFGWKEHADALIKHKNRFESLAGVNYSNKRSDSNTS